MAKLFACIISQDLKQDKTSLLNIAVNFSYSIELIDDGIIFDISGLERLMGNRENIAQKILTELRENNISGRVAIAENVDTSILIAREKKDVADALPLEFQQLPLRSLHIEKDRLNVFEDLGIHNIKQLLDIPREELISRYGKQFQDVIDVIEQKGPSLLTPNVREKQVSWAYELDFPVEDFEQLLFLLNHGLGEIFGQVDHFGFSTEHLDIVFKLRSKAEKAYEIKTSFPTLEQPFWLKLLNLRISLDAPEAGIVGLKVTAHFTKPRPAQPGLYAVTRPQAESLLLTTNKLKKLVGEDNVGIPVLLDQRLNKAFAIDAQTLPTGKERTGTRSDRPIIAFTYFDPPIRAQVLVRDKRLIFLRTDHFSGRVLEYSGVWRASSKWWDSSWKAQEWDVEIETGGVYRLCKVNKEWFLGGEYD